MCTYTNNKIRSDNSAGPSGSTSGKNDVGGLYRFQNAFLSNQRNQLDLQVQIGTELYPRQPIQTFPELLAETEKGLHSIGDVSWKANFCTELVQRVDTADVDYQYLEYAPILNQGYTAAFIELLALDDQTITANPHYALLGRCPVTEVEICGLREPLTYTQSAQEGRGCLNMFKPPKGTFFLCFDLDTFQNHGDIARSGTTIVNNQVREFSLFYNPV